MHNYLYKLKFVSFCYMEQLLLSPRFNVTIILKKYSFKLKEDYKMYEISARVNFAAAHQLIGYRGPCSNIHGHTWSVKASLLCDELNNIGITYDFKDLKKVLKACVQRFDHQFLNTHPPFDQMNPTSENLAKYIYQSIKAKLPEHVKMKSVEVSESEKYSVVYFEEQQCSK